MDHQKVSVRNIDVLFPFKPYELQVNYMAKVVESLQLGENAALESPTGTGKTLSLLCSSLAWLEQERAKQLATQFVAHSDNRNAEMDSRFPGVSAKRRIFYTSRTHSQLTQAVSELKRTAYNHVSAAVLASREHYCLHETVSKETDRRLQDTACSEKVRTRTCYYYTNVEKKKEDPVFRSGVMDVEDLVAAGKKNAVCPYYLAKELQQTADITFAPYNYLLDAARTKKMGVEMVGAAVIIDEAHNVEQVCEEVASAELKLSEITLCLAEVEQVLSDYDKYEQAVMMEKTMNAESSSFTKEDLEILKQCFLQIEAAVTKIEVPNDGLRMPGSRILEIIGAGGINNEKWTIFAKFCTDLAGFLSGSTGRNMFKRHGSGVASFASFLEAVFRNTGEAGVDKLYRAHVRKEENYGKKKSDWLSAASVYKSAVDKILSYWCFSPSLAMKQLIRSGIHSLILTSGTLAPLNGFVAQLQTPIPIQLENPHIIGDNQVFVGIVKRGAGNVVLNSSYETRNDPKYKQALGLLILNVARKVKGGILVFFPSYVVMNACKEHWENSGMWNALVAVKRIYVEGRSRSDFADSMNNYYADVKERGGAIFMAVCRGKVSEGLDFANDNGRAVIITGIPFPNARDPRVQLKKSFLDEMRRDGYDCLNGQDWYQQEASRAVNQAIGRVIRHANDYGAILLAETRFDNPHFINNLSSWVRPQIKKCEEFRDVLAGINTFFSAVEKIPRLQVVAERAAIQEPRNAFNHLIPGSSGKSTSPAMRLMAKRSLSQLSSRPPPAQPSTRGDTKILAMYAGEVASGGGSSSVAGGLFATLDRAHGEGRKKMKLVMPYNENSEPEVKEESPESKEEAKTGSDETEQMKKLKTAKFLKELKQNVSTGDYQSVTQMFRSFKAERNIERLVHDLEAMLLVKYKLPNLFMDVECFLSGSLKKTFLEFAKALVPEEKV